MSELADDDVLKDSQGVGSEVPLGKMVKRIKSQGSKRKKVKKNKCLPDEKQTAENDIDVLKMVRQINYDNIRMPAKFELSNGNEDPLSKKMQKDSAHARTKKRKSDEDTPVQMPKRRHSSSTPKGLRLSSGTSKTASEDSPEAESLSDAELLPDTDAKTKRRRKVKGSKPQLMMSLKQKAEVTDSFLDDEAYKSDEHDLKV